MFAQPVQCLDQSGASAGERSTALDQRTREQSKKEPTLNCRACGQAITTPSQRAQIDGNHQHHFTNPAGIQFRIGCFSLAPGCRPYGPFTEYYSWFQGYEWQMTCCMQCGEHLGWRYRCDGDGFFGLIMDKLIETESDATDQ